jgi:peroxiredoxin
MRYRVMLTLALALGLCFGSAGPVGADANPFKGDKAKKKQRKGKPGRGKAPRVGDMAPTFKLKMLDGKKRVALKSFRGKRPVILFFGSYT